MARVGGTEASGSKPGAESTDEFVAQTRIGVCGSSGRQRGTMKEIDEQSGYLTEKSRDGRNQPRHHRRQAQPEAGSERPEAEILVELGRCEQQARRFPKRNATLRCRVPINAPRLVRYQYQNKAGKCKKTRQLQKCDPYQGFGGPFAKAAPLREYQTNADALRSAQRRKCA